MASEAQAAATALQFRCSFCANTRQSAWERFSGEE